MLYENTASDKNRVLEYDFSFDYFFLFLLKSYFILQFY